MAGLFIIIIHHTIYSYVWMTRAGENKIDFVSTFLSKGIANVNLDVLCVSNSNSQNTQSEMT